MHNSGIAGTSWKPQLWHGLTYFDTIIAWFEPFVLRTVRSGIGAVLPVEVRLVLVVGAGAWYNEGKHTALSAKELRKELSMVAPWWRRMKTLPAFRLWKVKPQLVVRSVLPQHFPQTATGIYPEKSDKKTAKAARAKKSRNEKKKINNGRKKGAVIVGSALAARPKGWKCKKKIEYLDFRKRIWERVTKTWRYENVSTLEIFDFMSELHFAHPSAHDWLVCH